MKSNFNPLSAEELVFRINKIPRVQLAQLPTVLEYAPNISKELNINLYINIIKIKVYVYKGQFAICNLA